MADPVLRAGRRETDALRESQTPSSPGKTSLPAPATTETRTAHDRAQAGPFEAQLLGQAGQKRGLRLGKPLRDHARSAYLETEFAGPLDRRPPAGMLTKRKI